MARCRIKFDMVMGLLYVMMDHIIKVNGYKVIKKGMEEW